MEFSDVRELVFADGTTAKIAVFEGDLVSGGRGEFGEVVAAPVLVVEVCVDRPANGLPYQRFRYWRTWAPRFIETDPGLIAFAADPTEAVRLLDRIEAAVRAGDWSGPKPGNEYWIPAPLSYVERGMLGLSF